MLLTITLLELSLRLASPICPEPLQSLLSESAHFSLSGQRLHGGWRKANAILLPKEEVRDVLFIGDSFPFGYDVKKEDAFPERFEKLTGLTIANLGVPATGPGSYNRMLEIGYRYHSRRVFYCVFSNDFFDEGPPAVRTLSTDNTERHLPGDKRLFRRNLDFPQRFRDSINQLLHLPLAYRLFERVLQKRSFHSVPTLWNGNYFLFANRDLADIAFQEPEAGKRVEAVANLVQEAARFTSQWPTQFTVVLLPPKEFVYGPILEADGPLIYDDSHYQMFRKLTSKLDALKISYVDTTPYLRKRASEKIKLYFSIDGHFNEEGHEAVAQVLANLKSQ